MPLPDDQVVTTSERTMLDEVLSREQNFYKRGPGYEFSNGRCFEEGNGPYAP